MKIIIYIFAIIGVIGLVLMWSVNHDKKVMESADKYEQCVRDQYGVSPAFWYSEHGEYPECK